MGTGGRESKRRGQAKSRKRVSQRYRDVAIVREGGEGALEGVRIGVEEGSGLGIREVAVQRFDQMAVNIRVVRPIQPEFEVNTPQTGNAPPIVSTNTAGVM
jgi:hypothetical protein